MNQHCLLDRLRNHWHVALPLWMALWTILALFDASQSYLLVHVFVDRPRSLNMSLPEIVYLSLAEWYLWALLSPFLVFIALRFPFDAQRKGAWLAVMVLLSLAFAALKVALDVPAQLILRTNWGLLHFENVFHLFAILFTARFLIYVLICWAILGVTQALDYYRKFRERELRTSQLEANLAQAQLQVLKMQLHPHFLFNTLNAISALIHQDVDLADRMLARLGELLRLTLENAGTQEVSLRQELDFVGPYLEIQQSRLGSRLMIRLDIDPEAMDARVPNLLLQPLVENAIQHGICPRPAGGRIEVTAHRHDGRLRLRVRDDGPGLRDKGKALASRGVGLANTRARLQQMYGPDHTLALDNHAEGGLMVTLDLPFREMEDAIIRNGEIVDGKTLAPELV